MGRRVGSGDMGSTLLLKPEERDTEGRGKQNE